VLASGAPIIPATGGGIVQRIRNRPSGTVAGNANATSVSACSILPTTTRLWT